MKWMVFVNMGYYPYVGDTVEAETAEEALQLAVGDDWLPIGAEIYVAPMEAVVVGTMHGPPREPQGLLKLMQESNYLREERMAAAEALGGGYTVGVEGGSLAPSGDRSEAVGE